MQEQNETQNLELPRRFISENDAKTLKSIERRLIALSVDEIKSHADWPTLVRLLMNNGYQICVIVCGNGINCFIYQSNKERTLFDEKAETCVIDLEIEYSQFTAEQRKSAEPDLEVIRRFTGLTQCGSGSFLGPTESC